MAYFPGFRPEVLVKITGFNVGVNDGTNGYLYLLTQVSTADTIAAQDLTLIGQVTGVTNVADGDFVAF
jgi:hypothetical protein